MLPLLEECWTRLQPTLRERVGAAAYDAWLAGLRPVLMERGTVYLEAATRLAADRVNAMFRTQLAELLSSDFGTEVRVEVQAREATRFGVLEVSPQHPVVDDSNRTAVMVLKALLAENAGAAVAVGGSRPPVAAALPARVIVLHGPAGVGKTFLARWWRAQLRNQGQWFDLPALLSAFQACHRDQRVDELEAELAVDRPLVVDEVHRIAGKPGLQRFLLRVLQARQQLASPTILLSRWHPKEVWDLDGSLATAWLAGFVAAIERPGPLGRLRYLRALEGAPSRNGRAGHIEALAQRLTGSYPELRAAWAAARGRAVALPYLELIDPSRVFHRVRDRVAAAFGVDAAALCGKGQGRAVSRARKVLALLCQREGLSGGEIGRFLGRTRAAVSYMVLSLQAELEQAPELRRQIEGLQ